MLANGALVYPSQLTKLKAAWHWGRKCCVINEPLGEQGRTPLYVGLPSMWGSVYVDQFFSVRGLLIGDSDINE